MLNNLGYEVSKIEPHIVMSRDIDNAEKIRYYAKSNKLPFLCHVPTVLLRGHVMTFNFDHINHPFALAVLKSKNKKNRKQHIKKILKHYYKTVKPKNVAEVFGLNEKEGQALVGEKSWKAVHPWEERTVIDVEKHRPISTRRDNQKYGNDIGIEEGWHLFGPVSEKKLEVETERLEKLLISVEKKGFQVKNTDHDIYAMVLINDKNECRWIVYDGQHRTAVMVGLGFKKIPVLIHKVVERSDVQRWAGVLSGDFTVENALIVFDMVFYGKTIPCVKQFAKDAPPS